MNISTADAVIIELPDEYQPAEVEHAWAERLSDVD